MASAGRRNQYRACVLVDYDPYVVVIRTPTYSSVKNEERDMTQVFKGLAVSAALAALALSAPSQAQAPARTQVGTLNCDISGGIGMIIASRKV